MEIKLMKDAVDLVVDHIELARLECQYETAVFKRRFQTMMISVFCALSAWILLHVVFIDLLGRLGIPLYGSALLLALLDGGLCIWLYDRYGRRDPRAGEPFAASQEELKRNLQWIQQLLS